MKRTFFYFLPLALIATTFAVIVFGVFQKVFRSGADDPQIQMAEDASRLLEFGLDPSVLISDNNLTVDITESLSPFLVVYDREMNVVVSGARYKSDAPRLPAGVFQYAEQNGENRLTWQPDQGTRIAAVVIPYGGDAPGFVFAGRSLREVEKRIKETGLFVLSVWIASLVMSWLAAWIASQRLFGSVRKIVREEIEKNNV